MGVTSQGSAAGSLAQPPHTPWRIRSTALSASGSLDSGEWRGAAPLWWASGWVRDRGCPPSWRSGLTQDALEEPLGDQDTPHLGRNRHGALPAPEMLLCFAPEAGVGVGAAAPQPARVGAEQAAGSFPGADARAPFTRPAACSQVRATGPCLGRRGAFAVWFPPCPEPYGRSSRCERSSERVRGKAGRAAPQEKHCIQRGTSEPASPAAPTQARQRSREGARGHPSLAEGGAAAARALGAF